MLLLVSCNSKKNLSANQSFLFANQITIKSKSPIPNKSDLAENLSKRYLQRENKGIIPRYVFYYQYQKRLLKHPDRKKWDIERENRNRPVIHDSLLAAKTCVEFEKYLALRGYRFATATFKTKTTNKETTVIYHVDPGPRIYIDTFQIIADDPVLQSIIDSISGESHIAAGSPLDILLYTQEKSHLVRILQNKGFATFDEFYISQLEVDTSHQRVKAVMRILNPSDSTYHQKFNIGDVTIYPDYDNIRTRTYYDTTVRLITYQLPDSLKFTLEPEVIDRNLYVRPGNLSKTEDLERTLRNLLRVELIKFVNPIPYYDTTVKALPRVNYTLYILRNKKIDFQSALELTYSNIAAEKRRSLLGTAASINYRDRNIFGGGEVLGLNLESGIEFNFLSKSDGTDTPQPGAVNSVNLGLNGNLSFPRFMDPLRMYHMIGRTEKEERKPLGYRLHSWLTHDASTRMSLGYTFVTIQDLYQYFTVNANLSYVMQPDPSRKLTIDRLGFELFVPNAKPTFDSILSQNKFQRESFGKQLYTGFIFRDYLFERTTKSPNKPGYFKFLHNAELSGLEMLGINSLVNKLSGKGKEFILTSGKGMERDTVRFSHFAKAELDLRYYREVGAHAELAFRFNTGLAVPFGPYTHQVPYLKQFYVGGALSNRAWQIRELGPGGYDDPAPVAPNLPFYQTGDIKIDMTLEYRFNLFWYIKGGVFIDAANVWTLYDDGERTNENFDFTRFYKEFGIGYGYGVRLDFSYFILRLDFGYKLFNPFPVNGSRFLQDEVKKFPSGGELQLAVGHKF